MVVAMSMGQKGQRGIIGLFIESKLRRLITIGTLVAAPILSGACKSDPKLDHTQSAIKLPGWTTKESAANKAYIDICDVTMDQISNDAVIKANVKTLQTSMTQIQDWFIFPVRAVTCPANVPGAATISSASASPPALAVSCADAGLVSYIPLSIAEAEQGTKVAITLPQGKSFNKPVLLVDAHHIGFAITNDNGTWKLAIPLTPPDQRRAGKHVFIINDENNRYELSVDIKAKQIPSPHVKNNDPLLEGLNPHPGR